MPFKHVADLQRLSFLSSGRGGASQVGKFLTAYPADADTARDLAKRLHEVTVGLGGPRVPDEPQYADGSLVSFRYGAFGRHWLQLRTGRVVPALRRDGRWQVDERGEGHGRRSDAAPAPRARVLRDTYVCVRPLFRSPKGSTWLGFLADDGGGLVIVKEAYAHTMEDLRGVNAQERLRDEFACLRALEPAGIAPRPIDYWETRDSSFLVYRPIEGATFATILSTLAAHGLRPSQDIVRSWAASLCRVVDELHRHGYVSCDIKPSNLVLTSDELFLIDLELAGPPTDGPTGGMGTLGYSSPQQTSRGHGRSTADDVYALGATLLAMATLSDAALLPDLAAVVALESARAPEDRVYRAIARCIDPDPHRRPPSAAAVASHIEGREPAPPAPAPAPPAEPYLALAARIGDRILAEAVRSSTGHTHWRSRHSMMNGQAVPDLYCGSAGIALYLCALFGETGRGELLDEALRCGTWLWECEPPVPRQTRMPGLYFGECGPALLYVKLHLLTGEVAWLERAEAVAAGIPVAEVASPDIMTGLAGVGLLQLALWHASGETGALASARECAGALLARREPDRPVWRFPDDFDVFGGSEYAGFAHGSAGIGYFLAECAAATGEESVRTACGEVADWLVDLAEPALVDGSGLTWPVSDAPRSSYMTAWCHGAPGIARFLLRAHDVTEDPAHLDAALRALRMVARGAAWVGTTQCHGLAGNLDVLIDGFLATGSDEHLAAAAELGENLRIYERPTGWPSDELSTGCLDLMLGEAGVGAALLRLANPRLPHLVSCAAFAP